MAINAQQMWSMYLFNQSTPKTGAELLDENIIRDTYQTASIALATCCPRI